MERRKIMFFDIDGTLFPEDGSSGPPESLMAGLDRARAAGNLLFVNTGRPEANVDDKVRRLGFDGYIYGCGTHVVMDGEDIFYHRVSGELSRRVLELTREYRGCPMFERRDGIFFDTDVPLMPVVAQIREKFLQIGREVDRSAGGEGFSFDKFIVAFDGNTRTAELREELEKNFFWIPRGGEFAEIVPKPYSKASGIELVLERVGIDKADAYAIGDSLNDLPMFSAVGTGIAMGNGTDLIPYADYVTGDCTGDGVYRALERFGFFG